MAQQNGSLNVDGRYRPSIGRTVAMAVTVALATVVLASSVVVVAPFSRRLSLAIARLWSWLWLRSAGVSLTVRGLAGLDPGKRYVFVSNHQSALDIPLLYVALPYRVAFISKRELMAIPFLGWGMHAYGHVSIDRGNARRAHESIGRAVETLRRGHSSLVIFPEGTRSDDGSLGQFKTGSFRLAIDTGVELVPVVILGSRRVLPKSSHLVRPGPVWVQVGPPIAVDGLVRSDKSALAERVREVVSGMLAAEG